MQNYFSRQFLLALACLIGLQAIAASSSAWADSASLRFSLAPTALDTDASGKMSGSFGVKKSTFKIEVAKLAPSSSYEIKVNDLVQASFTTSSKGSARIEFRAPAKSGHQVLDFDPRGAVVSILREGASHLEGIFSGEGESAGSKINEQAYLTNLTQNPKARASVRFTQDAKGVKRFTVDVSKAPDGVCKLLVSGQEVAEMTISKNRGKLVFEQGKSGSKNIPLTFDPRGATVDLTREGTVLFTGLMKAQSFGANIDKKSAFLLPIPPTTDEIVGQAKAKWTVSEKAVRKFSVELEDVPLGSYAFSVNGISKGLLEITGESGELEFSNQPDGEALLLDFDPILATLTISQNETVLFSGVFDPAALADRPAPEAESRLDENLTSTGLVPAASAKARYEVDNKGYHRFKVEMEDSAVGVYSLQVGGVHRSSIRVVQTVDGTEGEVEFGTKTEPGKVALKFDPRGQLVEIVNSSKEVLFSHILGSGSAADEGGGSVNVPLLVQGSLFASSGASGVVSFTFQQDEDGGASFKLRALSLSAGSYDVVIGGITRGVLIMEEDDSSTEGEVEFDDTPKGDETLLNFDVLGQEVAIKQGDTIFFSRVIPLE